MTDITAQGQKIKSILDSELKYDAFSKHQDRDEEASRLFKKIFVEVLGFDEAPGIPGDEIPTSDWRPEAEVKAAYTLAESSNIRILYLIADKLSRTAQRYAITALTKEGWAQKGNFIAIFHAPQSEVWHLVSPYVTEGRTILQRYIAGLGENHRTLAENLAKMDVGLPEPLYDRILEAFRVRVITKEFYDNYKQIFQQLRDFLSEHLSPKESKQYAHLLLNRLMFIYFLQKKGWLAGKKDFMRWYVQRYKDTEERDLFHAKWLDTLFFEAMSRPSGEKKVPVDMPDDVVQALNSFPFFNGGLFERSEVDKYRIKIPDNLILSVVEAFLERYNFTVTEESPFDVDVAVDPAMLGKIYESLIAEEERGKAGIFYTPRVEVDLMCRLGLLEYLTREREFEDNLEGSLLRELVGDKDKIVDFMFTPLEEWDSDNEERFRPLKHLLDQVTVCDPACGSGAFLVGMLQVLMELYRKVGIEPEYMLKERIIYRSIHGADIKDWAIRMAEFRLWLALIESETDAPPQDGKPILPNFTFNLRCGDSIVQKIGDEFIKLDLTSRHVISEIKEDLEELERLRERYYWGDKSLEELIHEKQVAVLEKYINRKIDGLKETRSTVQQTNLQGEVSAESRQKYDKLTAQIKELQRQKEQIREVQKVGTFIWGLDFIGPMTDGGFDIVIANPPYVRHEEIIDPSKDPEELATLSNDERKALKRQYKSALQQYVEQIWQESIGKSVDIYTHFFYKGLELAKDFGALVFISSNSWLDVNFGKYLQSFLLRESHVEKVIDNSAKRSFEEADVNTVITVAVRKKLANTLDGKTDFLSFKAPFEDVHTPAVMKSESSSSVSNRVKYEGEELHINKEEYFRKVSVSESSLWKLGGGSLGKASNGCILAQGTYDGEKWGGKFLRAPDIFFTILRKGEGKLVKLGDIAEVKRGFTTGSNEFFYVKPLEMEISEVMELAEENSSTPVKVGNSAGWEGKIEAEFLKPVIKSPREIKTIRVRPQDLNYLVFLCHSSKEDLKKDRKNYALRYIEWGENAKYICKKGGCSYRGTESKCPKHGAEKIEIDSFPDRPTCASRERWWDLGTHETPTGIWFKAFNYRFLAPSDAIHAFVSDRFYEIHLKKNGVEKAPFLIPAINSTLLALTAELTGRVSLGEGALDNMTYEAAENMVLDSSRCDTATRQQLLDAYEGIAERDILSIFEESGIDLCNEPACNDAEHPYENINQDAVSLDKVLPDRRELDKVIFEALGLTEEEQLEIYKAVVEMVKNRLMKARSV